MNRTFKPIKCCDCGAEIQPTNSSQRRCKNCQQVYELTSRRIHQRIVRASKKIL